MRRKALRSYPNAKNSLPPSKHAAYRLLGTLVNHLSEFGITPTTAMSRPKLRSRATPPCSSLPEALRWIRSTRKSLSSTRSRTPFSPIAGKRSCKTCSADSCGKFRGKSIHNTDYKDQADQALEVDFLNCA